MKNTNWYYKEFNRVEKEIEDSKDEERRKELQKYWIKLDEEFYKLEE